MRYWLKWAAFALAVIILALTVVNASWLASPPPGGVKLIAHRAVAQQFSRAGVDRDTCTARLIEPPVHDYLENTVRSVDAARRLGADMVEVDIAPTADGKIAIFHDWTVDCRTDGKGETRDLTMAQLKALDPGFGYSADGGKTFPLRGTQKGAIPTLEEMIGQAGGTPLLFNFKSRNPAEADRLAAALKAAYRNVERSRDAFYGAAGPVKRIRQLYPNNWAFSMDEAKACTKAYALTGWTGIVPKACHGGTIMIPINYQWAFWGWPNRLQQRMAKVGARVIVIGPYSEGTAGTGLSLPEQLGKVPASFKGYIWVEDIWTVGPAFRPSRDFRTEAQVKAADAGLKRRRATVN